MGEAQEYLGTELCGYRLTAVLSSHELAGVFRGENPSAPEPVAAVKVLYGYRLETDEQREAFLLRTVALRLLSHPHLLPIIDVGIEQQIPFVITAHASGHALHQRLHDWPQRLLPQESALCILAQVGQALHYMHQQGLTHGNVKATNVLFDVQGDALLADYELALPPTTVKERSGPLAVSRCYQAPELQQDEAKSTPASDQYALGCLAYELFSGQPPFAIASPKITGKLYRTRKLIPPRRHNPGVSEQIEQAILRAMSVDPQQRYDGIQAFLDALGATDTQMPSQKPPVETEAVVEEASPADAQVEAEAAVPVAVGSNVSDDPGRLHHFLKQDIFAGSSIQKRGRLLLLCLLFLIVLAGTLLIALNPFTRPRLMIQMTPVARSTSTPVPTTALIGKTQPKPTPTPTPLPEGKMLPTVPPPTPTPWPTPTPTPVPTQGCDVAATKSSDWGSGFTLTLTITNTGSRTVDGWRLTWTFDGDQRITNVWGATAYQNFQSVRLTNLSSNGTIESGQSVTAGVNVSYRFSNDIPTKFALNGITCQ